VAAWPQATATKPRSRSGWDRDKAGAADAEN
jgi:hypothetical protein